ncbi:deoxyribonuclease IV [Mycoplasmatota bacterium]|nr:deoxyribonuclease IV [Mycoplasmatota bacterium]
MLKIGSHVGMGGKEKMLGSVNEALSYNANCFMIYTGAPQNTRRSDISILKIPEAHELMIENDIPLENVVVHAPYIMNLANPDPEKRKFAIDFLTEEVKRTSLMGAGQIVVHPGSHLNQGPEKGMEHIINGLKVVLENTVDLNTKIALETMAGKGTEVGISFEEIGYMITEINSDRITVCFDTCHTHDAGYELSDFDNVLKDFDKYIGRNKISVFHINDSKNSKGSHKDRHENIGFGYIGFESLLKIINHLDFINIPKILETPYVTEFEDSKNKVFPPYKYEIDMIKSNKFDSDLLKKIREKV